MDNQIEILLNSYKNISSVNADMITKIELSNAYSEINEYNINNIVNANTVFSVERQENSVYRIYGKIELMSLLNGLKIEYGNLNDFFNPEKINSKSILNSFNFYLVRPSSEIYEQIPNTNNWKRQFEIIATPSQFELFPIGYSNNVYGEQLYSYNFNVDIDISNYFDCFNFPLTQLFIYVEYVSNKPYAPFESFSGTTWNNSGIESKMTLTEQQYGMSVGDILKRNGTIVISDLIEYIPNEFTQKLVSEQLFYISTYYYNNSNIAKRIVWKYNPLIPLQLRYLSDNRFEVNSGSTSYDKVSSIPYYATNIGNGNFVWRDILNEGYVDPLSGIGNDVPFVNKKRYFFNSTILDIVPDLNDSETNTVFDEIWYTNNSKIINVAPIGDINDYGKPCK